MSWTGKLRLALLKQPGDRSPCEEAEGMELSPQGHSHAWGLLCVLPRSVDVSVAQRLGVLFGPAGSVWQRERFYVLGPPALRVWKGGLACAEI